MLEATLDRLIKAKQGNKEFALFYYGDGTWQAEIGNPSKWVRLGEVPGEIYSAEYDTPLKAVNDLSAQLLKLAAPPHKPRKWWHYWLREMAR